MAIKVIVTYKIENTLNSTEIEVEEVYLPIWFQLAQEQNYELLLKTLSENHVLKQENLRLEREVVRLKNNIGRIVADKSENSND